MANKTVLVEVYCCHNHTFSIETSENKSKLCNKCGTQWNVKVFPDKATVKIIRPGSYVEENPEIGRAKISLLKD